MSAQFGRWNFDGRPVDRDYLEKAKAFIAPYGPDDASSYSKSNISVLYHSFYTTKESRRETQPYVTASGAVLTWDGRLDNRAQLILELDDTISINSTDIDIVAAAYDRWGTDCFAKLLGDWALVIWNHKRQSLILAKDSIGVRQLYYSIGTHRITWSTILDALVLCDGGALTLNESYIAGWLSLNPAPDLTPYVGFHSVPPASFVTVREDAHTTQKYWSFDPTKTTRYAGDADYEEHFRTVFREAVRRRLRSDRPIVAELSGGMDSSSIVCMADIIMGSSDETSSRLDTISLYNDGEPNWDERPYFRKVEEKRGRVGCQINTSEQSAFPIDHDDVSFDVFPGSTAIRHGSRIEFARFLETNGHRIVLSGIGGDEALGGVPTPIPELRDLLARFRLKELTRKLKVWALDKREPWLHLLGETLRGFFPSSIVGIPKNKQLAPWLTPEFVRRNLKALQCYNHRTILFGPLPSFQANTAALEGLRRQLAAYPPGPNPLYEKRYPYLDRSLLEFIFSIPREQLVRAGQRRSLMRRALREIVPDEILQRKRKAFVLRAPTIAIKDEWGRVSALIQQMKSQSLDIVDQEAFSECLQRAWSNQKVPMIQVMRTLYFEIWLRNLCRRGIVRPCRMLWECESGSSRAGARQGRAKVEHSNHSFSIGPCSFANSLQEE
jgi:asparagine synthase (glutamine-hydrolysing)